MRQNKKALGKVSTPNQGSRQEAVNSLPNSIIPQINVTWHQGEVTPAFIKLYSFLLGGEDG